MIIDCADDNITRIARIIARRDGTTVDEEADTIVDALMEIRNCGDTGEDPEAVWAFYTGLEPDYLMEVWHLI